jgi:hypothetical protein
MKRNIIIILTIILSGCSEILEKDNLSSISENIVWNDAKYATSYVNRLYSTCLPVWNTSLSSMSDEAYGGNAYVYGQLTTTSVNVWNYSLIRNINIFLAKIDEGSIADSEKNMLKAQVLVLRAWKYFEMVRVYGGVPIIEKVQNQTDDLYVTRNKTSECINFIVKDLDIASGFLPWKWTGDDAGRVTKATALALKARVLLYYASPQFNPNKTIERWNTAYNASKIAVDELAKNGYALYNSYENFWFNEMNNEVVFATRFQDESNITHNWDAGTRPLEEAVGSTGANQPSIEMVNSYPMNNGKAISDPTSGYDSLFYWKNRDPRFTASIAYNGCLWELSGKKGRIQWTFAGAELNPTNTGFYCRKAINPVFSPYLSTRSSTDWVEMRFAEVLLNHAECSAETGKSSEAYDILKQIRKRAGIQPGADGMYGLESGMTGSKLIKTVLLERKIELAFEGKRYWDLRRRRLFAEELNGTKRHGIYPQLRTMKKEDFLKIQSTVDINKDYSTYFKDSYIVIDKVFPINFKDNYHFYAIPTTHLETNSKLQQTQGWDNGDFNPYD